MREYKYYIQKINQPTNDVLLMELADIRGWPVFDFRPGQYVMIHYRNSKGRLEQKHTFSIASSPLEKRFIRLGIKINGKFTRGLINLKVGNEIFVEGPYGDFIYDENKYADVVMIAGGIGITPFVSALNYAADKNLSNKVSLIYSNRTLGGNPFYHEIKELVENNKNIRALFAVTDEIISSDFDWVANKRLDARIIHDFIGEVYGKTFFICGPNSFMESVRKNLYSLRTDRSQIRTENFSMTGTKFWPNFRHIAYATSFSATIAVFAFYMINNPVASGSSAITKNYDPNLLLNLNQAVSDRIAAIGDNKNKAIADLKLKEQIAATAAASAQTGTTPAALQKIQTPVTKQATTVTPQPAQLQLPLQTQQAVSPPTVTQPTPRNMPTAPMPPPMPRTAVS